MIFQSLPVLTPDMDRLNRLFWLFREIRPIIYGHPEAIVEKLRKLLDCEDVRRNTRAVVIDEAHLVEEWQVFDICLESFPFTVVLYRDL